MKHLPLTTFAALLLAVSSSSSAQSASPPHPSQGGQEHHGEHDASDHAYRHEGHDPHHRFDDPAEWAERFEDPERDEWQKPDVVLEMLQLEPDSVVADIGSATGYFPTRIAPHVPEGRVWGVDIEPAMVRYLNERARREGTDNLFSTLGTPEDPLLPEPVDVVLIVNTYHHISDRPVYFERLADSLAPGARVVIVDFKKGELPVGPPDEMKIPPERVQAELQQAGYSLEAEEYDRLPHQYVLVFSSR